MRELRQRHCFFCLHYREKKSISHIIIHVISSKYFSAKVNEENDGVTGESEVTSSDNILSLDSGVALFCPCEASTRLDNISQADAELTQREYDNFQSKLSLLLASLLGEKRLAGLGHPHLSSTSILEKVLRLTGTTITCEDDLCTDSCKKVKDANGLLQNFKGFLKSDSENFLQNLFNLPMFIFIII